MFPLALLNASSPPSPPSPPVDPALTLALLHFDGVDGSTTYTDSSIYNRTVTGDGSLQQLDTSTKKFGLSSLMTTGWPTAAKRIEVLLPNDELGMSSTKKWTVEGFVKINAVTHTNAVIFQCGTDAVFFDVSCGAFKVNNAGLSAITETAFSTSLLSTTEFVHIAVVGDGVNIKLFIDGNTILTVPYPAWNAPLVSTDFHIGNSTHTQGGHYDEIRIRKEAVYTADFTPPTAPFTY